MEIIRVGMGEYKTAKAPALLVSFGLGSCVGVALYDGAKKIGGLAHIMLPDSSLTGKRDFNPGKFADTAIDYLIAELRDKGANTKKLVAKIAGGAQMFQLKSENSVMMIGKRNVEAVRKKLNQLNIDLIAEDVEGNYGRTIEFCCETGELTVKTIGHGIKIL
ncbi:Chemoreceptor glutamine deamidase CheD [Fervidicola ferrireducens]|jgi:chemotaxis protein CheD|uniref:Probable chemoreceptor glutamine deamidase CheD n=1 Tax=Fervidicola ferrireducens TaxID=520764 RepID=A0A140LAR1_9FIRM|nr:chemotaxis protein CheD [Fervidicola ferrireducens]KXG77636.1 Chemoreceptor glutamine deamidase CheD [Fervidicola ferrireducens]